MSDQFTRFLCFATATTTLAVVFTWSAVNALEAFGL